jgi:hypothetical protein
LGSEWADLPVEVGAAATLNIIKEKGKESNGKFFNIIVPGWEDKDVMQRYDGAEVPW